MKMASFNPKPKIFKFQNFILRKSKSMTHNHLTVIILLVIMSHDSLIHDLSPKRLLQIPIFQITEITYYEFY
jgi:hypothetical protein